MEQLQLGNNLSIRVFLPSDVEGVTALYRACFAEPPWFETFDPEELAREFLGILSWPDAVFLVGEMHGELVGGAVGFDLSRKTDVMTLLPPDAKPRFYLSELFVAASMRKQHIAQNLLQRRFTIARERGYAEAVVRTSVNQPIIRSIYEQLGFKIVATQEVESTKLINGLQCSAPDCRIILAGPIR